VAGENTVVLVGNITGDPELRYSPQGVPVLTVGLAVTRRWLDRASDKWNEETSFFDLVCWRDLAEHVRESLRRGNRVIAVGRLVQRSWEDRDGNRRSRIEVLVDDIGPSLRFATASVVPVERRALSASPPAASPPSLSDDEVAYDAEMVEPDVDGDGGREEPF
jgi:single-strand DNA-binding protein